LVPYGPRLIHFFFEAAQRRPAPRDPERSERLKKMIGGAGAPREEAGAS
jgi:hypothetical protein